MRAGWLTLLGVTACSFTLDEGGSNTDSTQDTSEGFSSSTISTTSPTSNSGAASTTAPSSAATTTPAEPATSSAGATTTPTSEATTTTSVVPTSQATNTNTTNTVDPGTIDAGMDTDTPSVESSDDDSSSSEDTGSTPGEEPEPGKLAGITERHNYYRAMVDTDEPLGDLVWDAEIAELAQEWAEVLAQDCSFMHSMREGLGENLATFGASTERGLTNTGSEAVDMWHSEIDCYTFGTIAGPANMGTEECSAECDEYGGCGHYTQVVWRETLRVGCGVASCFKDGFYWDTYVCNYDPPGNYIGEYPY
jgi:pathogenesis-related protein 1